MACDTTDEWYGSTVAGVAALVTDYFDVGTGAQHAGAAGGGGGGGGNAGSAGVSIGLALTGGDGLGYAWYKYKLICWRACVRAVLSVCEVCVVYVKFVW